MNDVKLGQPKYAKKCSYILQDDNLYPNFTVHETMVLAANLKIADMSVDEKNLIVSFHQFQDLEDVSRRLRIWRFLLIEIMTLHLKKNICLK